MPPGDAEEEDPSPNGECIRWILGGYRNVIEEEQEEGKEIDFSKEEIREIAGKGIEIEKGEDILGEYSMGRDLLVALSLTFLIKENETPKPLRSNGVLIK